MKKLAFTLLAAISLLSSSITYAEVHKEHYPNGDIKREIDYTNGKKNGQSKFYLEGNRLLAMAEYKMGIRHGVYVEYDENKNISVKDVYENGKKVGRRLHYDNGQLMNGQFKKNDNGDEYISTFKDGLRFGLQKNCTSGSCVVSEVDAHGNSQVTRSTKGRVEEKYSLKSGVLDGLFMKFRDDKLYSKIMYKNGDKHGPQITYHSNLEKKSITQYKDGFVVEETIYYDKKGRVVNMTNPYNGTYTYDLDKVKSEAVRRDIDKSIQIGADPFTLKIEETSVSIFGYQTNQPIRARWYTPCVLDNGQLQLINSGGLGQEKYCIKHDEKTLVLTFKKSETDPFRLLCDNCEEYGFPGAWIRN